MAVELTPQERAALTVAWSQVQRGEFPMPACATVCVAALARLFYEQQPTLETSPVVPKGHFWRGETEATHCQNCGRSYFAHTITDEATLCPVENTKTEQQITACKYCGFSHGPCDKCII